MKIKCKEPDCTTELPNNDKWTKIKQGSGWLFLMNGDSYCPKHIPKWVSKWRKKKKVYRPPIKFYKS